MLFTYIRNSKGPRMDTFRIPRKILEGSEWQFPKFTLSIPSERCDLNQPIVWIEESANSVNWKTNNTQFFQQYIMDHHIKWLLEFNQYPVSHQALIKTLGNFIMQKREVWVCWVAFPKSWSIVVSNLIVSLKST